MKKTLLLLLPVALLSISKGSSQTDSQTSDTLDVVHFNTFKIPINTKETPFKLTTITANDISNSTSVNNAYLLRDAGGIFVQQSQLGGGSPVIRGFEASRILLVVDGVRMNNAIYRSGHLQNIITVDKNIIQHIHILHGGNATLHGSDGLGGVIDIETPDPLSGITPQKPLSLAAGTQYNSAFNSFNNYVKLHYGHSKLAGLTIASFNKIGHLTQGSNYKTIETATGWKRTAYIKRINGIDSIIPNTTPNKQLFSAYSQLDLLQKLVWIPNTRSTHTVNLQYSTSSDIPRYDRLTDRKDGQLRWAEWYYGPQKRLLGIYKFEQTLYGIFEKMTINLNYQNIEESRYQRLFRSIHRQSRIEQLHVFGYTVNLTSTITPRTRLQAGTDAQFNMLHSTAYHQDITTGDRIYDLDSRYPDGNNHMHNWGIYTQLFHTNKAKNIHLHTGLRAAYTSLFARFENTAAILNLPFREASRQHIAYSGNIGMLYQFRQQQAVSLALTTAYRVPNIDDLAKVFESAGGVQLVVPNPGLKPEQTVSFDFGYKLQPGKKIKWEWNGFYTFFNNAIVLDHFRLNGQDSVLYNGTMTPVVANQNKARAYIYGAGSRLEYMPLKKLRLSGAVTYTYGRYFHTAAPVPLDHIPPLYGSLGAAYQLKAFHFKTNIVFNGAKRLRDYNPYGEDNLRYATTQGMPGWYTWNVYASGRIKDTMEILLGVENILDANYRVFASGISAPGRNFVVKLHIKY